MKPDILSLATFVRKTIEENKDYWIIPNDVWFKNFPWACCDKSSEILLKYLNENWINDFNFVYKVWATYSHVWLENESFSLDITADQFNKKFGNKKFNSITYLPKEKYFFNTQEWDYMEYRPWFLEYSPNFYNYKDFYDVFLKKKLS